MYTYTCHNIYLMDQMVKSLPAVWETWVWPPGEGNDNPLQYSCLENSMDRGALWATVYGSQRVLLVIIDTFLELKMKEVTFYTCLDIYHFVTLSSFWWSKFLSCTICLLPVPFHILLQQVYWQNLPIVFSHLRIYFILNL